MSQSIEDMVNRFDDLVAALERIAIALEAQASYPERDDEGLAGTWGQGWESVSED